MQNPVLTRQGLKSKGGGKDWLPMSRLQPGARKMNGSKARQLASSLLYRRKANGSQSKSASESWDMCDKRSVSVASRTLSWQYFPWLWYSGAWEILSPVYLLLVVSQCHPSIFSLSFVPKEGGTITGQRCETFENTDPKGLGYPCFYSPIGMVVAQDCKRMDISFPIWVEIWIEVMLTRKGCVKRCDAWHRQLEGPTII